MPTRNISLTATQDAFIRKAVEAGDYQNASETVRDAIRALQTRRREDALKLAALRRQIKAGTDALARGDFAEIDAVGIAAYIGRRGRRRRKAARREATR